MKKFYILFVVFFIWGCGMLDRELGDTSSPTHSYVSDDNIQTVDFIYDINSLDVSYSVINIDETKVKSYLWNFGDNNTSSSKSHTHHYSEKGLYTVTLEAVLNNGKKIYHSKKINVSLMDLFFEGFGAEPDKMYFALHITGSAANGLFMQQHKTYAKDLSFQLKNGNREKDIIFSRDYKKWGLWDLWGIKLYNVQYGWADYDGKKLEMPFYLGDADFKTDINSKNISFTSFVIKDKENTIFLGDPSFVRCKTDDFKFDIPMEYYDENFHRNIALFTVNFTDQCAYSVTFDGFLEK